MKNRLLVILGTLLFFVAVVYAANPYVFKTDVNMTSHKILNLLTPTVGTDAANKTYVDSQVGIAGVATWTLGTTRYYCADYDTGSDANACLSDVSMAACGAVACKTLEQLRTIVPRYGNGRSVMIAVASRAGGAVYKKIDGITDDTMALSNMSGYAYLGARGTGTQATASAVKFANDTADKNYAGGQTVTGTETAGYRVAGAPTTSSIDCVKNSDGTAPGLSAEPTLDGKRIRWDVATPTVALRNTSTNLWSNTTSVIVPGINFAAVPVAGGAGVGDVFYIEEPAVAVDRIVISQVSSSNVQSTSIAGSSGSIELWGFRAASAAGARSFNLDSIGDARIGFVDVASTNTTTAILAINAFNIVLSRVPVDESGGALSVGTGVRVAGAGNFTRLVGLQVISSFLGVFSTFTYVLEPQTVGSASVFAKGLDIQASLTGVTGSGISTNFGYGNFANATSRRLRIFQDPGFQSVRIRAGQVGLYGIDLTGNTTVGGVGSIRVQGTGTQVTMVDVVGSTGNTDVGLDVTGAVGATIDAVSTANTISGTLGDIRVAGPAITTWAGLTTTNVIDNRGNRLLGTGGNIINSTYFVTNQSGGTLAIGNLVRQNGTTGQVTSAKADTSANATGVLGVLITPPASTAGGYMAVAGAPWIQMDVAATVGNLAYLSEVNAGQGKSVPPAVAGTNQKFRLGVIESTSGTLARVAWRAELFPQISDGLAP
jgi:hypothetical protein